MEEHHADWDVFRWTDETVRDSSAPFRRTAQVAERLKLSPRCLADLIRVQAVSLFGGLYFDTDTVPLRPLDQYVGSRGNWVGTAERTRGTRTLANASFGFRANDSFLEEVWNHADEALRRGVTSDHHVAGPRVWRSVWEQLDPWAPQIDYTFANEWDRDLQKTMGAARPFDLDELRHRFPSTSVLHVVWYYRQEGLKP